jgi:hypothetical protein
MKIQTRLLPLMFGRAVFIARLPASPSAANMSPTSQLTRFSMPTGQRAPADLVEAPGFKAGDNLSVKGPVFTSGQGKVHALNADAFKIEFSIATYHLIVSAERINATQAKFITIDVKQNRTVEAIGTYVRTGNVTVFDMGKGSEVEKLTVKNQRAGYFETDVVQPGKLSMMSGDARGTVNLKFSKK